MLLVIVYCEYEIYWKKYFIGGYQDFCPYQLHKSMIVLKYRLLVVYYINYLFYSFNVYLYLFITFTVLPYLVTPFDTALYLYIPPFRHVLLSFYTFVFHFCLCTLPIECIYANLFSLLKLLTFFL